MTFQNKTVFITGGSRGIGKAIALRLAREGANIAIAAKTAEAHPKLEGTIHTAAAEIEAAGGKALALQTDIRFEDQIGAAVQRTADTFGGIDILINNASAINLQPTEQLEAKRFDLM
ncbi:MAG: SDR family NAD(P)-dependent oxidoreductase, partial [Chitinophagaceae bacterium]